MRLGAVGWIGGSWRQVVVSPWSVRVFRTAENFITGQAACYELIIGSSHVNETPGVPIKRPEVMQHWVFFWCWMLRTGQGRNIHSLFMVVFVWFTCCCEKGSAGL